MRPDLRAKTPAHGMGWNICGLKTVRAANDEMRFRYAVITPRRELLRDFPRGERFTALIHNDEFMCGVKAAEKLLRFIRTGLGAAQIELCFGHPQEAAAFGEALSAAQIIINKDALWPFADNAARANRKPH